MASFYFIYCSLVFILFLAKINTFRPYWSTIKLTSIGDDGFLGDKVKEDRAPEISFGAKTDESRSEFIFVGDYSGPLRTKTLLQNNSHPDSSPQEKASPYPSKQS